MMSVQLRREAKREQIRAAAGELFLSEGYAGTSMDAVTAAAGISKETLYRYYESKAALFADVLGQLIAEPPQAMPTSQKGVVRRLPDLEDLLIAESDRYLARLLEPRQLSLVRIVLSEGNRFPELVEAFRGTLPATGGAVIIGALEAGRTAGLVAGWVDLRMAARAFAGLLMMFILRDGLLAAKPQRPDRRQLAAMVRLFVHGIGAELKDFP